MQCQMSSMSQSGVKPVAQATTGTSVPRPAFTPKGSVRTQILGTPLVSKQRNVQLRKQESKAPVTGCPQKPLQSPKPFQSEKTKYKARDPTQMCGIIGIFKQDGVAAGEIYEGLLMLQHRGQDSAGIVTFDGERFRERKDNGLVKDVFGKTEMDFLVGSTGIGHVRYPTAGGLTAQEAQPFFVNSPLGIYLIHNGNLTNTDALRAQLDGCGLRNSSYARHLRTESDSEVLLNIFADEIYKCNTRGSPGYSDMAEVLFDATAEVMRNVKGSYSVITIIDKVGVFAFRDPNGIRPLVLGKRTAVQGNDWAFASEDCAFGPIGFSRVRDVEPGEAVLITEQGDIITRQCAPNSRSLHPCIFEYIYLARPDSVLNDISVYDMQLLLGKKLAERIKSLGIADEIDLVVPVPDGSRPAAIEIASELGVPYREGLVKNRYVGRTFIMPDQQTRELSVKRKLNAMRSVFEDKNVLLIDDSIVRGTTMTQIVKMVRNAGATKVFLASASPPVKYPNVYGVDMPSRKEFIANNLTEEEVCEVLGADKLIYQSLEDLIKAGQEMNPAIEVFDASCFDGKYITGDIDNEYLENLEKGGRGGGRSVSRSTPKNATPLPTSGSSGVAEGSTPSSVSVKAYSTTDSSASVSTSTTTTNGVDPSLASPATTAVKEEAKAKNGAK